MKAGFFGFVLATLGVLALIPVGIILDGWALSILWNWFMAPYLHAPVLGIAPALGIALVVRVITNEDPKTPERKWYEHLAVIFVRPAAAVASGWILTKFLL